MPSSYRDLSATIHLLGDQLGQIIRELEGLAAFDLEESVRRMAIERRSGQTTPEPLAARIRDLDLRQLHVLASSFTIYFDLINIAEDAARVLVLRERECSASSQQSPGPESLASTISGLRKRGVTTEQMRALLGDLHVELVLTAHPTQSKRRTVLSKLQRISAALYSIQTTIHTPLEMRALLDGIRTEIASLWLTSRSRTERPTVTDEVRTGLYFVDKVFWEALPQFYAEFDAALSDHCPGLTAPRRCLTLASWIGGDRDGNPFVTHKVTAETLRLHRGLAIERHKKSLRDFSRRMSISAKQVHPSTPLLEWLKARRPLPARVAYLEQRYADEPYRLALALLAAELEEASSEPMTAHLLGTTQSATGVAGSALIEPLKLIEKDLPERLAKFERESLVRQLEVFGLTAAKLDMREDSLRLTMALAEILRALKLETDFESKEDSERVGILRRFLELSELPKIVQSPGVTEATAETWALFRLIARTQEIYGTDLLGPFIISMTHGAADILTALLLAKWANCDQKLKIVPLFETVADLEAAPGILNTLFSLDLYRKHLASTENDQMIMIGYSDSNKDGGYLASNWALYRAQEEISSVCRKSGVRFTFFHGRGGTVARGGGPADRAIRAQPPGTVNGRLRVTEQGETLELRYGNPHLARRHLHQMVSAVLDVSLAAHGARDVPQEWRDAMALFAGKAKAAFRNLVYETPDFPAFWKSATIIEELSHFRMSSRPTIRRSGGLKLENVRAIPWVFSWREYSAR